MAKVAVVGGGAAGVGAAIGLIKAGMQVSLFETEARLGGQCASASVALWDGRAVEVDGGMASFNRGLSADFTSLLDELGLRCAPVDTDVLLMTADGTPVWYTRAGSPHVVPSGDDRQCLLEDIKRFRETAHEVLDDPTYDGWSVQRYLDAKRYSDAFRPLYLEPQAVGCFPLIEGSVSRYPIRALLDAWRIFGLFDPLAQPRVAVEGGMHNYANAVERWLRARGVMIWLSTRVASINRTGNGVRLRISDRQHAERSEWFDHVVVAVNSDQIVALLDDVLDEEVGAFNSFPTRRVSLVVHQDPALLPTDRAAWCAYNVAMSDGTAHAPKAAVTVYLNRLQHLSPSVPDVFVTLAPVRAADPDKTIAEWTVASPSVVADVAKRVDAIQGKRRTWFCGSYLREPFAHEQAYRSGLDIADRLIGAIGDETERFDAGSPVSAGGFDSFLREIPLFAELDPRALSEVQLAARPFQVARGTVLFRQGDASDGLYLVKHGEIDIERRLPGDTVVRLARIGRGASVGEISLLDHNPRSANATAAEPTAGYFISRERFQFVQSDFRPSAFAVMDCFRCDVAARTRRSIKEIASLPASPVQTSHRASRWPEPIFPAGIDARVLLSLPFFRTLGPTDLAEFVAPLKRYEFGPGEVVFAGDEPPASCLLVVRGALATRLPGNSTTTFAVHGPGQMVGELALIDGGPQPLDCLTREPTIVLEIDRYRFDQYRRGGSLTALRFFDSVTSSVLATLRKADAHLARLEMERRETVAPKTGGAECAGY